jgi:hypothetical protein
MRRRGVQDVSTETRITLVEGEERKPRALGLFLVISIAVTLGIVLASQVVSRWLALEVEEGPDGASAILLSPLGKFALRKTSSGNKSLLLVIYPGSKPEEQASLDWIGGPGARTRNRRQLTVLTYQTGTSLEQIASWYQQELGPNFGRTKGWSVAPSDETSGWMRRVESGPRPEAITFHQELAHRARGVLILPGSAGQGSEIKLYDYMESP